MNDGGLLDTHVLLWAVSAPERLSPGIRSLIQKGAYAVSVASLWELINKREKRDAPVKDPAAWWERYVTAGGTRVLPIRARHVLELQKLPWHHRDPYDRILIAQSIVEDMTLITADDEMQKYPVRITPACL